MSTGQPSALNAVRIKGQSLHADSVQADEKPDDVMVTQRKFVRPLSVSPFSLQSYLARIIGIRKTKAVTAENQSYPMSAVSPSILPGTTRVIPEKNHSFCSEL